VIYNIIAEGNTFINNKKFPDKRGFFVFSQNREAASILRVQTASPLTKKTALEFHGGFPSFTQTIIASGL